MVSLYALDRSYRGGALEATVSRGAAAATPWQAACFGRFRDILTGRANRCLVVFDAAACKAYAIYLQQNFARAGISSATMAGASVDVRLPGREVNVEAIRGWRAAENAILRQMGKVRHD
jgi:hypothetical protein